MQALFCNFACQTCNFMRKIYTLLLSIIFMTSIIASCSGKSVENSSGGAPSDNSLNRQPKTNNVITVFDADSAYSYVAAQTAFGPRIPGTEAHARCIEYITEKLEKAGGETVIQDIIFIDSKGEKRTVKNIKANFRPEAPVKILLAAHYDSRPHADQDSDPSKHSQPVMGANDGASGVAVILEIARNFGALPPNVGLEIAILDQEDNGDYDSDDRLWCIGSQVWADESKGKLGLPQAGILLDMVGGKNARFNPEYFSVLYARPLVESIWAVAHQIGYSDRFPAEVGGALNDDHIYLMEAGFPCVDIVENQNFETGSFAPTWHTTEDTLENIDPTSLKAVGDVVMNFLSRF